MGCCGKNKEDQSAFNLMFSTCRKDCPQFKVEKGNIVDWSDTEAKGLRDAIGQHLADNYFEDVGKIVS